MTTAVERWARAVMVTGLGALWWWLAAVWLWPWCGPWLVVPCPLPTLAGCWVAAGVGALWGGVRAWELDLAERRRLALPRARRHSRPIPTPPWAAHEDAAHRSQR
jgi:hypothetical protein